MSTEQITKAYEVLRQRRADVVELMDKAENAQLDHDTKLAKSYRQQASMSESIVYGMELAMATLGLDIN